MQAKLTLKMEKDIIDAMKRYVANNNKSLSRLVEDFFKTSIGETQQTITLSPLVKELTGIISEADIEKSNYIDYNDREILDVFLKLQIVFVGDEDCRDKFKNNVMPDDILLINSGRIVKAIGIVKSEGFALSDFDISDIDENDLISATYPDFDFYDAQSFANGCKVCIYKLKEKDYLKINRGVTFSNCYQYSEQDVINLISIYSGEKDMLNKIKNYTGILRTKKNIILQGAHGTGKTYITASLAVSLINPVFKDFDDHQKVMAEYNKFLIDIDDEQGEIVSGQIGFVTFHQSLDYEEFIEGLKPSLVNNNVTYKIEDGIFKLLANKAKYKKNNNFSEAYEVLIEQLEKVRDENPNEKILFKDTCKRNKVNSFIQYKYE